MYRVVLFGEKENNLFEVYDIKKHPFMITYGLFEFHFVVLFCIMSRFKPSL